MAWSFGEARLLQPPDARAAEKRSRAPNHRVKRPNKANMGISNELCGLRLRAAPGPQSLWHRFTPVNALRAARSVIKWITCRH